MRQANRITVRFPCDWGVTPQLLLCLLIDPLLLLSLSLPVLFHLFVCLTLSFSLRLILRANESKAVGIVLPGETSSLSWPYFLLHNVFTLGSAGGTQLSITLHPVPANSFTTFKLATVTTNHALASRMSRCCRLPFSKAAAVNLSLPEWEGRQEWPRGRPQLTSHLLAQAAFARRLILYVAGLCCSVTQ